MPERRISTPHYLERPHRLFDASGKRTKAELLFRTTLQTALIIAINDFNKRNKSQQGFKGIDFDSEQANRVIDKLTNIKKRVPMGELYRSLCKRFFITDPIPFDLAYHQALMHAGRERKK